MKHVRKMAMELVSCIHFLLHTWESILQRIFWCVQVVWLFNLRSSTQPSVRSSEQKWSQKMLFPWSRSWSRFSLGLLERVMQLKTGEKRFASCNFASVNVLSIDNSYSFIYSSLKSRALCKHRNSIMRFSFIK